MIGTTHFINAVVQRRHLMQVAAIRIGMPASASLPPFCDWPRDLAERVHGETFMLEGGHDYDGRPIMPFDRDAIREARGAAADPRARHPVGRGRPRCSRRWTPSCEVAAAEIIRRENARTSQHHAVA